MRFERVSFRPPPTPPRQSHRLHLLVIRHVQTILQSNSRVGTSAWTRFGYNQFDDLVQTTDMDGNARLILYDGTGNKTGTGFIWHAIQKACSFTPVMANGSRSVTAQ